MSACGIVIRNINYQVRLVSVVRSCARMSFKNRHAVSTNGYETPYSFCDQKCQCGNRGIQFALRPTHLSNPRLRFPCVGINRTLSFLNPNFQKTIQYHQESSSFEGWSPMGYSKDLPIRMAVNGSFQVDRSIEVYKAADTDEFVDTPIDYSGAVEVGNEGDCVFLDIRLNLALHDRCFGFYVMGGVDEGFIPRIDEVSPRSPAERADLVVGDEIVLVNGESLEGCTHSEVIAYIHKCIKTRTICLRVRRQSSQILGPETPSLQNAYVIGVDEDARNRLESVAFLRRVTPVDMTKLTGESDPTPDYSQCNNSSTDVQIEENPLYESQTTTGIYRANADNWQQSPPNGNVNNNRPVGYDNIAEDSFIYSEPSVDYEVIGHENNSSVDYISVDMNGFIEKETPSKKGKKKNGKSKKSAEVINAGFDKTYENVPNNPLVMQNHLNVTHDYDNDESNGSEVIIDESGPHREMAVDCPNNFIPAQKGPPRYPGVSQTPTTGSIDSRKHNNHAADTPPSRHKGHRDSPTMSPQKLIVDPDRNSTELTPQQLELLRQHQEEIKKRRELAQEEDFLRTSLRGSKKLQALESRKKHQQQQLSQEGIVNSAFDETDDMCYVDTEDVQSATLPLRQKEKWRDEKYMTKNISPDDLYSSLQFLQSQFTSTDDQGDLKFLSSIFQNPQFQNAVDVHNTLIDVSSRPSESKPVTPSALQLSTEVMFVLRNCVAPQAMELLDILESPVFKNTLFSHDQIADLRTRLLPEPIVANHVGETDFEDYTTLPDIGEQTVKIVHLEKTDEPLGATVRNDGEAVMIGRIVKGSTAEKSGLLHEGDEILEVNGIDMRGKSINDVSDILASMTGTIRLMLIPSGTTAKPAPAKGTVLHVKAYFDYEPEDDIYLPCQELGISFKRGDVLHVISQEDTNWWQAYREGEDEQHTMAGLVPSKHFQEQYESQRQLVMSDSKDSEKKPRRCMCGRRKKKKRKGLYTGAGDEADEILTYEEVAKYYPQPNRKRPIVLIGPPSVGRHELRQRLMETDFDRFAAATPHTSRPQQGGEVDTKDFYFVPRHRFEQDIELNKFVEHGQYEKNLYGTSVEAVRQVVNSGRICVLNLDPESLRLLRNTDLKPFVIFVRPSNLEMLRQIWQKLEGRLPTDEELRIMMEKAREMEEHYGHHFDHILNVTADMDRAYNELLDIIDRLEVEAQWVPKHWLDK